MSLEFGALTDFSLITRRMCSNHVNRYRSHRGQSECRNENLGSDYDRKRFIASILHPEYHIKRRRTHFNLVLHLQSATTQSDNVENSASEYLDMLIMPLPDEFNQRSVNFLRMTET